ncbi:MAG: hypothetical protein HZA50_03920 [Planctomycetes bacterium]|nr:hypothetical protein [Planctomycetota bacterium]
MEPLLLVFVVWVLGFGTFSIVSRKVVATTVARFHAPKIVNYYLILTPIILLEEALNIEVPYFWGIIPIIFSFYICTFLPIYIFQRLTRSSWLVTSAVCGFLGWINEFLLGGRIHHVNNGLVLAVLGILCWLIYAVMAILPSAYLQWELNHGFKNSKVDPRA